jgi:hypothetical protein
MVKRTKRVLGWMTILMLAAAGPALADNQGDQNKAPAKAKASPTKTAPAPKAGPSPEKRAKMATRHEQMAICLRSTRPISECHMDMHKACEASGDCPMGQHGHAEGMQHGARHGHGAPNGAAPADSAPETDAEKTE